MIEINFDLVKPYYDEPHRSYHNCDHILEMLNYAEANKIELTLAQKLAILYHDLIYVPGSSDNEILSAEMMIKCLKTRNIKVPESVIDTAYQIILDTKYHEPTIKASEIVLDLDLMRLGQPWDVFCEYTKSLRQEYSYFSNEEWNEGRGHFYESYLDRDSIFTTQHFIDKFEAQAIENLTMGLEEIENES